MSLLDAILLGVVQGLTEFLPISSSGHLVLAQHFLGVQGPQLFFDVLLHVGTLGAILVVYRRPVLQLAAAGIRAATSATLYRSPVRTVKSSPELTEIFLLVIGTLPAAFVGIRFAESLEAAFGEPRTVAWMLLVTGLILLAPPAKWRGRRPEGSVGPLRAVLIGLAQALALLPGISRSGSTISMALFTGVSAARAARFSFLLSIPAILGAALVKLTDGAQVQATDFPLAVAGSLAAFAVGWVALRIVIRTLENGSFWMFSVYCFLLGAVVLATL